jgi:Zn-dependent peptidase ImmA (M78 family)
MSSSSDGGITFDPCTGVSALASTGATAQQTQGVRDGVALWHKVATLELSADPGSRAVPVGFQSAASEFHGLYEPDRGDVLINEDLTDPHQLAVVIAHELGHAMGLVHVTYNSVMQAGNLTIEPQPADAQALQALWGTCTTSDAGP